MSEDELARLFEPSRRANLGLYIAKGIVEAHGGSLRVASAPEAGTTFVVTLPRA